MRKREFEHGVIYNGDCLDVMPAVIKDHSIDMILADLPYGTTACTWDERISLKSLWREYKRIVKNVSSVVLTGDEPFTSLLITSQITWFKHRWIWDKSQVSNPQSAKRQPLKHIEDICVFGKKIKYNPQGLSKDVKNCIKRRGSRASSLGSKERLGHNKRKREYQQEYTNYPKSLITFPHNRTNLFHPTQKPVELFQYLILTYTNKGDIVLDNVIGSGTTAIAAYNTDRRWIGIEKDPDIFDMACERIEKETRQQNLFN